MAESKEEEKKVHKEQSKEPAPLPETGILTDVSEYLTFVAKYNSMDEYYSFINATRKGNAKEMWDCVQLNVRIFPAGVQKYVQSMFGSAQLFPTISTVSMKLSAFTACLRSKKDITTSWPAR